MEIDKNGLFNETNNKVVGALHGMQMIEIIIEFDIIGLGLMRGIVTMREGESKSVAK